MLARRGRQEQLSVEDPQDPPRVFGEEVEAAGAGGNTGNQLAARVWQLLSGLDERLASIEERFDHGQQRLDLNVRAPKRAGPYFDQRVENPASRFGAERAVVARPSPGTGGGDADRRPLPLTKYLDEREEEARVDPTAPGAALGF